MKTTIISAIILISIASIVSAQTFTYNTAPTLPQYGTVTTTNPYTGLTHTYPYQINPQPPLPSIGYQFGPSGQMSTTINVSPWSVTIGGDQSNGNND
jgi:hypothetical protein